MAELILFHHAHGLTDGVLSFADELRLAGHLVHTPDLYEGETFSDIADGVDYAESLGFQAILDRGRIAAESLPGEIVYAGFSLGTMPAQMLAQIRADARGALLFHGCIDPYEFSDAWPAGLPLQMHMMEGDRWLLAPAEDLATARRVAATVDSAELFLYPGDDHLFADSSLIEYDDEAATLLLERTLTFLADLDARTSL